MGCMQSISSGKVDLCFCCFFVCVFFGVVLSCSFHLKVGYSYCSGVEEEIFNHTFGDKYVLRRMLSREDELRSSQETQQLYSVTATPNYLQHVVNINLNIQRKVLKEFGFEDSKAMLDAYHMVRVYAPAIAPCVVYGRYDASMANGSVGVGDKIPFDVTLFSVPTDFSTQLADGYYKKSEVALGHYKKRGRPLVLLGMSAS